MLTALAEGGRAAGLWLDNGGEQTLESYRVQDPMKMRLPVWRDAVPQAHLHWMSNLDVMHREGNYVFVHAGIRPGLSLKSQKRDDLLWIREPFLSDISPRDFVVVHGHTPKPVIEIGPTRIGVDTGAVMGGKLTCLVLEGETWRALQS